MSLPRSVGPVALRAGHHARGGLARATGSPSRATAGQEMHHDPPTGGAQHPGWYPGL
jgi:hypothetical protein